MKALFDTNILVSAMIEAHPNHAISLPWIQRVRNKSISGYISTHSIAELYAVITRLPLPKPLSTQQVHDIIINNLESFHTVDLESADYLQVLKNVTHLNITGGGIYDAIIAQTAIKANVDILLTFNSKHFIRLGKHIAQLVKDPSVWKDIN
ncbi:PIN domain-containing protein [Anabaena sphaerica FACHB-251]|uniref:Ribonuclease VapC n=1 Tax=Anabaena sphaerica FACHB-251 TaxID=2692883 RepID=A0A926WIL1_9NOST|nr:PIN domain-containing protein [Anabaena sphaerica]MBD2294790.1 PIN domain-containing protein [Anabaena sphaerica FACHB-251]